MKSFKKSILLIIGTTALIGFSHQTASASTNSYVPGTESSSDQDSTTTVDANGIATTISYNSSSTSSSTSTKTATSSLKTSKVTYSSKTKKLTVSGTASSGINKVKLGKTTAKVNKKHHFTVATKISGYKTWTLKGLKSGKTLATKKITTSQYVTPSSLVQNVSTGKKYAAYTISTSFKKGELSLYRKGKFVKKVAVKNSKAKFKLAKSAVTKKAKWTYKLNTSTTKQSKAQSLLIPVKKVGQSYAVSY